MWKGARKCRGGSRVTYKNRSKRYNSRRKKLQEPGKNNIKTEIRKHRESLLKIKIINY